MKHDKECGPNAPQYRCLGDCLMQRLKKTHQRVHPSFEPNSHCNRCSLLPASPFLFQFILIFRRGKREDPWNPNVFCTARWINSEIFDPTGITPSQLWYRHRSFDWKKCQPFVKTVTATGLQTKSPSTPTTYSKNDPIHNALFTWLYALSDLPLWWIMAGPFYQT